MISVNNLPNTIQEIEKGTPDISSDLPSSLDHFYELNIVHGGMIIPYHMKKCCKKYKKGKRCKKCPNQ